MINRENIYTFIKRDEGFSERPYLDTEGYLTIGYGQKIGKQRYDELPEWTEEFPSMPRTVARTWLVYNVDLLVDRCRDELVYFRKLGAARQYVLVSMAYQMGWTGLMKFKKTLSLVQKEEYALAAEEMLDSLWARQTPLRANMLSVMMLFNSHLDEKLKLYKLD